MASVDCLSFREIPKEILLCSLCDKETRQPKFLPCLHVFCKKCLDREIAKLGVKPGEMFGCPSCGEKTTVPSDGTSGFPDNVFFEKLLDTLGNQLQEKKLCDKCLQKKNKQKTEAVSFCFDEACAIYMCEACQKRHRAKGSSANHEVEDLSEMQTDPNNWVNKLREAQQVKCPEHHKKMELFCKACEILVCDDCQDEEDYHYGHEYNKLQERWDNIKDGIFKQLKTYDGNIQRANAKLQKEKEEIEANISKTSVEAEEQLEKWKDNAIKAVEDRYKELLEDISKSKDRKLAALSSEKENIEKETLKSHFPARDFVKYLVYYGKVAEILFIDQNADIKAVTDKKVIEERSVTNPGDIRLEEKVSIKNAVQQIYLL